MTENHIWLSTIDISHYGNDYLEMWENDVHMAMIGTCDDFPTSSRRATIPFFYPTKIASLHPCLCDHRDSEPYFVWRYVGNIWNHGWRTWYLTLPQEVYIYSMERESWIADVRYCVTYYHPTVFAIPITILSCMMPRSTLFRWSLVDSWPSIVSDAKDSLVFNIVYRWCGVQKKIELSGVARSLCVSLFQGKILRFGHSSFQDKR